MLATTHCGSPGAAPRAVQFGAGGAGVQVLTKGKEVEGPRGNDTELQASGAQEYSICRPQSKQTWCVRFWIVNTRLRWP